MEVNPTVAAAVCAVVFVVVFVVTFGFLMKRHIDRWEPHNDDKGN